MDTPQDKLLEELAKIRFSGEEDQVLKIIIRKTYGFNKKEDVIPLIQFVKGTGGMAKSSICRALNSLIKKNVIYKNVKDKGVSYGIQKSYTQWKPFTKKSTVYKKVNKHLQKSKKPFTKKYTSKETIKETISKDKCEKLFPLVDLLIQKMKENDPKAKTPLKDSNLYLTWADSVRLCIERDKRTEEEIIEAINFSQNDDFWKANILSTAKLREKLPTLLHQARRKLAKEGRPKESDLQKALREMSEGKRDKFTGEAL